MEAAERELLHQVVKTVDLLVRSVESSGGELAGLRMVNHAMLSLLVTNPHFIDLFAAAIANVISADKALLLNTDVSDEALEQRTKCVLQLLPPPVQERVLVLLK